MPGRDCGQSKAGPPVIADACNGKGKGNGNGNGKTAYKVVPLHKNAADRETHEKIGFHEGWGTVAGQLEEVARSLARSPA